MGAGQCARMVAARQGSRTRRSRRGTASESRGPTLVDRLQFKRDYMGYIDRRRTHIYIIDLVDRDARQVTFGEFDNSEPAWSPDGDHIVFVSNRTNTPDRNRNTDLWRVDANVKISPLPSS